MREDPAPGLTSRFPSPGLLIPVRDNRRNSEWTGGMSLKRSQACRSQRKRYAACLTIIMANWYEVGARHHACSSPSISFTISMNVSPR
jgi:hypothetical protein